MTSTLLTFYNPNHESDGRFGTGHGEGDSHAEGGASIAAVVDAKIANAPEWLTRTPQDVQDTRGYIQSWLNGGPGGRQVLADGFEAAQVSSDLNASYYGLEAMMGDRGLTRTELSDFRAYIWRGNASPQIQAAVDKAIANGRAPTNLVLYRAANVKGSMLVGDAPVGSVLHSSDFVSTSLDPFGVAGVEGASSHYPEAFRIEVPKGTPMTYAYDEMHEVVLGRGTRFKLVGADHSGPRPVYTLRVLP